MKKKRKYFSITFCCSQDEKRAIEQKAEECGMSASKYCKLVMTNHQPKYRLKQKHLELLQDVRKIANDLQRIANFFKNKKYAELMEELKKIIDILRQLLYDCNS